jgi:hypothetical protein
MASASAAERSASTRNDGGGVLELVASVSKA